MAITNSTAIKKTSTAQVCAVAPLMTSAKVFSDIVEKNLIACNDPQNVMLGVGMTHLFRCLNLGGAWIGVQTFGMLRESIAIQIDS